MKITHVQDEAAGVYRLLIEFPAGADPDHTADLAWAAVSRILTAEQHDQGTAPPTLRVV